jgi:Rrf2 family iron-sulfur cluster assembly transcriptional regulator
VRRQGKCHGADAASGARCMTHELWATLNEKMVDYLDSVSLQDLVDQQRQECRTKRDGDAP